MPKDYVFYDFYSLSGIGKTKDYDKEYFYINGMYFPMGGKTFKSEIIIDKKAKEKVFSKLELQKSFDHAIAGLGGVKLNNGNKLKDGQEDILKGLDSNASDDGYLHSLRFYQDIHTYVIRKSDKEIWIQYDLTDRSANIAILETKTFVNEMDIIPASEIQKQISDNGKAVLYINFDIDKATLKPDGVLVTHEIAKFM